MSQPQTGVNVQGLRQQLLPIGILATIACGPLGCGGEHEPTEDDLEAWDHAWDEKESKTDSTGCSGVVVPDKSGFAKRVALTFDDGPNPATTPKILDVLADHGIKATFFINGNRVNSDAARAVLDRIIDEGHILANHTQTHKQMTTLSVSAATAQIGDTHAIIEDFVQPKWFRFPFGESNCTTMGLLDQFELTATGWHVDSADWCYASSKGGVGFCDPRTFRHVPDSMRDDMLGFTMQQTRSQNGGILLFHDIHAVTADAIEPLVNQLESEGFTFVNIDDATTFPLLNGVEDNSGWVGDICTEGDEICGFRTDDGTGSCHEFGEDFGFCTIACEGFCEDRSGYASTFCTSLDGGTSGSCVSKADTTNDNCAGIPGTAAATRDRFIGSSSASASTAEVCVPSDGPSCTGLCGTDAVAPGSDPACFCEASCVSRGDCCGDFEAVCG
ncbi:MAG: polysaccharide deacetylase family protein [Myxococcota bacterium]